MQVKRALLLLMLLIAGAPCFSQVTISPQSPTVLDTIYIQVPLPRPYAPTSTTVSMASNKITIAFATAIFDPAPPSLYNLNWPVGPLPAGTYQVEIQQDQSVVGSTQFEVLPRPNSGPPGCPGCAPLYSHTDMWWNPSESGWGASIVQHGSGNIFGVFFVYADNGTATWYMVPGGQWTSASEFRGNLYQTRGPQLEGFDPNSVNVSLVGSATIVFDVDPNKATVYLTMGGKTIQKTIQRLSY